LRAGLGPLGAAQITMQLEELPEGSRVNMIEVPVQGLISIIPDRAMLIAIWPRNRECLWRLAALAERLEPNR
jgi:hypothetical protein